jgi:hypothetical protein
MSIVTLQDRFLAPGASALNPTRFWSGCSGVVPGGGARCGIRIASATERTAKSHVDFIEISALASA